MLQLLQRVAVEFVKVVSRRKGLSPAAVEASGGKIFSFGSYRLGVYGPGECIAHSPLILRLQLRIRYRYPRCWAEACPNR